MNNFRKPLTRGELFFTSLESSMRLHGWLRSACR